MVRAKAFLFDLNGTMVDDMEYHVIAWEKLLNEDLKAGLTLEAIRKEMYGRNDEVMIRIFGTSKFTVEEMFALSHEKEKRYQQAFLPHLKLISGLPGLLEKAKNQNVKMAIGSAALPFNVDFVLDNLHIRHYFQAIVTAQDVKMSKPHPETYLKAARLLGVEPADCIVFEDAPKGVEAAENAGMKAVVLTTMHENDEFSQYENILGFVKDYNDPVVASLC